MTQVLVAIGILVGGGVAALLLGRWSRAAIWAGATSAVLGCGVGLIPAFHVLFDGATESMQPLAWDVPYGSFAIELDTLSAVFLIVALVIGIVSAISGGQLQVAQRREEGIGASWFAFNLMIASVVMVLVARNAMLFLVAWEMMALTSFAAVLQGGTASRAGWLYLVASHFGTAFLLASFILLGQLHGSLDFGQLEASGTLADVVFVLAVVGFGTKAGLIPFHVWLPEAYCAAPSHVSAYLSGVLSKAGIYGLLRVLTILHQPAPWWAWLLIGLGALSAVWGILSALVQRELKRLFAYSSIENVGIITIAIGAGLIGVEAARANPSATRWAALGFAAALFHVLNHAAMKSLLFLGEGVVAQAAGTTDIERLGGLLKRIPWTGGAILVGCLAIAGLPPLNGFASEFLVYLAAFREESMLGMAEAVPALVAIGGLALAGGLAIVCFAKAFGLAFLGEPRSDQAAAARTIDPLINAPLVLLAIACIAGGLFAPTVVRFLEPAVATLTGAPSPALASLFSESTAPLNQVALVSLLVWTLSAGLALLRWLLLSRRDVRSVLTWDCGYANPTSRLQYTGSSFTEPLSTLFGSVLQILPQGDKPGGLFAGPANYASRFSDLCMQRIYQPLGTGTLWVVSRLRWLQQGHVNLYVLYIAVTMLALLVWFVAQGN